MSNCFTNDDEVRTGSGVQQQQQQQQSASSPLLEYLVAESGIALPQELLQRAQGGGPHSARERLLALEDILIEKRHALVTLQHEIMQLEKERMMTLEAMLSDDSRFEQLVVAALRNRNGGHGSGDRAPEQKQQQHQQHVMYQPTYQVSTPPTAPTIRPQQQQQQQFHMQTTPQQHQYHQHQQQSATPIGLDVVESPMDPPGLIVVSAHPNGPAHRAGLRSGDVITYVDGHEVRTREDLRALLDAQRAVSHQHPQQHHRMPYCGSSGGNGSERCVPIHVLRDVGAPQRIEIPLSLALTPNNNSTTTMTYAMG
eukprot:PhM_4_TR17869/c1_g1_i2/m.61712